MQEFDEINIPLADVALAGNLTVPSPADGLVIFAHGSGSSRFSPRNRWVAEQLNEAGFATLLFDLLTEREAGSQRLVFDIPMLAGRMVEVTRWAEKDHRILDVPIGYFGASTGAAAALEAAAQEPERVRAVVSRGGRPDLATGLDRVQAPTLLIVGGSDNAVLELNRRVQPRISRCDLVVVPGATHLFEEPGALEEVAREATRWFRQHLVAESAGRREAV